MAMMARRRLRLVGQVGIAVVNRESFLKSLFAWELAFKVMRGRYGVTEYWVGWLLLLCDFLHF